MNTVDKQAARASSQGARAGLPQAPFEPEKAIEALEKGECADVLESLEEALEGLNRILAKAQG